MLDLFDFRSRANRGRMAVRGLALVLVLSSCTLVSQAEAAEKGHAEWSSSSGAPDCESNRIELNDGTEVVLPGADPSSCPIPDPVDCDTFLGSEASTPAAVSNIHQVKAVCEGYPGVRIATCPGGDDLHPQLTLPNAVVIHGDPEQLDAMLQILRDDYDLQALIDQYTDPDNPGFYSMDFGLGYAVVPVPVGVLEQIIDNADFDLLHLSSVHVYQGHKMSRGHPVDEFDDHGLSGLPPAPIDPTAATVVVVDAGGLPGEGGIRGHGAFAAEVIRGDRVAAGQVNFKVHQKAFFDDTDIVPAILSEFFNNKPGEPSVYPSNTVVNLSFGAYNCGLATSFLTEVLERLVDNGHRLVASAGNDETNELAFPAALAIDWDRYGATVFNTEGKNVSAELSPKMITSVGSVTDVGDRSCFSNYGVWVENWFPGEEVYAEDTSAGLWGGTWSGTSFAAPQAAALLASGKLLNQKAPDPLVEQFSYNLGGDQLWSYCAKGSGYEPQLP